ncbi:hypothetical protein [Paracidovorax citrulli]
MSAIIATGVKAVPQSVGPTTPEKNSPIGRAVQATRAALIRCGEKRFPQLDKNGNLKENGSMDVEPALALLDHVEAMIPKYLILPDTRQRLAEAMVQLSRSIESICKGIDTINTPGRAAEAVKLFNAVQNDQQNLINLISKEIPDESKLRHVRDGAQAILLLIGIIAVLVSVSLPPLGVPLFLMAAVSLSPSVITFLWNRAYDWRTTPNPAWKPLRDLVSEIRHSMERADMLYASAMMKHMDTRMDRMDSRMDQMDARMDQMNARMEQMDARMEQMDARMGQMDARMEQMDARMEQMDARMNARMDQMDARMNARMDQMDARVDRLEQTHAASSSRMEAELDGVKRAVENNQRTTERMMAMLEALMEQRTTPQHAAIDLTFNGATPAANDSTGNFLLLNKRA